MASERDSGRVPHAESVGLREEEQEDGVAESVELM